MQRIVNTINPHQISIHQANTYKIIIAKSSCKPYCKPYGKPHAFYKLQRLESGWAFVSLSDCNCWGFDKQSTPNDAIDNALSSSNVDIYQFDSIKEAYEWVVNNL